MNKIINYLPELFGGGGSVIGLITFGKVIEVIVFAVIGALVGLIVKELWVMCKKKANKIQWPCMFRKKGR